MNGNYHRGKARAPRMRVFVSDRKPIDLPKHKIHMKKGIKAFLLAMLLSFNNFTIAQSADEIINKHIEAIGGKDNWSKLKTLRTECTMKSQGTDIKFTIVQVDKIGMRQDIAVAGMVGYSIINTKQGWNYAPWQGHTKAEAMTEDDVKNAQDDLWLLDEFITYKELGKTMEYLGKDDVDGTECYKLKMTAKDGKETTFYIDPSTYFVIKQTEKMTSNGQVVENSTFFSDYKKLDEGIVYPMSISGEWGEMSITKLEINTKVDESIFTVAK